MNADTIQRYQPGGDIYAELQAQYGTSAAAQVAAAAATGDNNGEVNAALTQIRWGNPLDTSTASIFYDQITTDPLAAPLASLNNVVGNTALSFLKSPWVIGALVVTAFFLLGGKDLLKGWLKKLA